MKRLVFRYKNINLFDNDPFYIQNLHIIIKLSNFNDTLILATDPRTFRFNTY